MEEDRTEELVARARSGDEEAREALFRRVEAPVLDLVRRRMSRRMRVRLEPEDVAQSVMREAVGAIDRFESRGDGALFRWLARIVENKLRTRAREMNVGDRDPDRVHAMVEPSTEAPGHGLAADVTRASQALMRKERQEAVRAALKRLPERERRLIELRDLESLSWAEVVSRADEPSLKAAQACHGRAWARLAALLRK